MLENKAPQQDESKTEKKRKARGKGNIEREIEKERERGQGKQSYMRVSPNVKGVVSFNYQAPGTVFLSQFASSVRSYNCHTFC